MQGNSIVDLSRLAGPDQDNQEGCAYSLDSHRGVIHALQHRIFRSGYVTLNFGILGDQFD